MGSGERRDDDGGSRRAVTLRYALAAFLFAALVVFGSRPIYLRLLVPPHRPADVPGPADGISRKPLRFADDPLDPELRQFLHVVAEHTRPGEKVGFLMAPPAGGFSYAYWRASYELPGRTVVLPLDLAQGDRPDVIATWGRPWPGSGYVPVWNGGRGEILRWRG